MAASSPPKFSFRSIDSLERKEWTKLISIAKRTMVDHDDYQLASKRDEKKKLKQEIDTKTDALIDTIFQWCTRPLPESSASHVPQLDPDARFYARRISTHCEKALKMTEADRGEKFDVQLMELVEMFLTAFSPTVKLPTANIEDLDFEGDFDPLAEEKIAEEESIAPREFTLYLLTQSLTFLLQFSR